MLYLFAVTAFIKIEIRAFECGISMALFIQGTHYCAWSGFSFYKLTATPSRGHISSNNTQCLSDFFFTFFFFLPIYFFSFHLQLLITLLVFSNIFVSFCPFSFGHCHFLSFFELRILITVLVFSNFSYLK